ncbi:MAG: PD-(D/E)XK nuclease-like domain-containing protein [Alsobacter sp.]
MALDTTMSAELRDELARTMSAELRDELARTRTMSAELRDELARNDVRRLVDPRHVPVRYSHLKAMERSPAHYVYAVQHDREETLSMRLGSAAHALVFGTPQVVVFRGGMHNGKSYKGNRTGAMWEAFQAQHATDVIVSESELAAAEAMVRAITTDMVADSLLFAAGTMHERRIEWTYQGRQCAGTMDAFGPAALCDLKAVKDADPRWFPFQARRMAWHGQVAWYRDGAEAAGLGARPTFLVAVENSAPYVVTVFQLDDATYLAGQRLYRAWFDRLLECEAANYWPGYADGVVPLAIGGEPRLDLEENTP